MRTVDCSGLWALLFAAQFQLHAPCPTSRTGQPLSRREQQGQGRERKVTRPIGSGCGYGYGYDGQMSDPQGMPLTGNAPWGWGTTGHAANRHCPPE